MKIFFVMWIYHLYRVQYRIFIVISCDVPCSSSVLHLEITILSQLVGPAPLDCKLWALSNFYMAISQVWMDMWKIKYSRIFISFGVFIFRNFHSLKFMMFLMFTKYINRSSVVSRIFLEFAYQYWNLKCGYCGWL